MRVATAFNRPLDLQGAWVRTVSFEPGRVVVTVALKRRRLQCPKCSYSTPFRESVQHHDSVWRHMDLGVWRLEIHARLRALGHLPTLRVLWAISRRRPTAVPRVLPQPPLELLDRLDQIADLIKQRHRKRDPRLATSPSDTPTSCRLSFATHSSASHARTPAKPPPSRPPGIWTHTSLPLTKSLLRLAGDDPGPHRLQLKRSRQPRYDWLCEQVHCVVRRPGVSYASYSARVAGFGLRWWLDCLAPPLDLDHSLGPCGLQR